MSRYVSRREACRAAGVAAVGALGVAFGMTGCSSSSSNTEDGSGDKITQGYASDCEVHSAPVTLYIAADENLKRAPSTNNGLGRLEAYFTKYQALAGRGNVTFGVKYYSAIDLASMAVYGFEDDTDGVVALSATVERGVGNNVLYGGAANTSVRTFTAQLSEKLAVVRKTGGSAVMPDAETVNGEDSNDGLINKMQSIPNFDGHFAVSSEETVDGMMTNKVLARWGLYTESSGVGGNYDESIADKMVVFDTPDEVVQAVKKGTCELGFVAQSMLWGDAPGVERVYSPSLSDIVYSGASIDGSEMGGAVRDFFEYIVKQV